MNQIEMISLEDVGIEAQEVPKHFNPYPNNRHNFRYVCPNCLDTFLDKDYSDYKVCWKCGQWLVVVPKRDSV